MDGLFHTLETIGSGAFIDLPNLKEFLVKATTPPTWEYNDVFFSHEGGIGSTQAQYLGSIKLYVPEESIIPEYTENPMTRFIAEKACCLFRDTSNYSVQFRKLS